MQNTARLYGVSEPTLYRALAARGRPKIVRRADRGTPRVLPQEQLERYCELIAAIKVRTSNKKQRHLSTGEAIRLLEEFGLETPDGFVQAPKGRLTRTTVNRYLQQWGFDRTRLLRQPAAVRFQAEHSNDCWQFDLSPSDLKAVKEPSWVRPEVGAPTLMLFSVVDDRSGVAYQEYHCVYGEDVEAALRFLFNAMAPKPMDDFPFHGIPQHDLPGQRPDREEPGLSAGDALFGCRRPRPYATGQGWPAGDGAVEGEGRAALPHRERDA